MSAYLTNLAEAVRALHGCDCAHSNSMRVGEQFEGETVFDGNVETFTLSGHQSASEAYAWAYDDNGETRYIAVLRGPPINDPSDAIRAAIASGVFR